MNQDIYMQTVFGQQATEPQRIEVIVNPMDLPPQEAVFYTTLVNRLIDAGIPIKPHTFKRGMGVSYQMRENLTTGKLEWESWDFGKTIRYIWTSA